MYVHCTYLRRHVYVCMYDQYVLIDVLLQGIRLHDSTSDCRGGFIACPQPLFVSSDSHDDIAYHIVYKINKQTNKQTKSLYISQI